MADIFVISDDVVGKKMAGPGIRAWELTQCLARDFEVILGIPDYSPRNARDRSHLKFPFEIFPYSLEKPAQLRTIAESSRIILTQGYILSKFPFLKDLSSHLIIDLYVPFPLENLFVHKWNIPNRKDRDFVHLNDLRVFNEQIIHGDHFLCANTRQRDLFMGSLMSLNRIDPERLDLDPGLEDLISVVPFGLSEDEEAGSPKLLRQNFPQIKDNDVLLIWGGVLTNWFDPLTLIRALHEVQRGNPDIKLFFLSTKHPNPLLPSFAMAREAADLSNSLGLTNRCVFFNEDWVDYDQRGGYFRDADIGVSIHQTHFETYYSFRTRILDYLKYELPVICTEGDFFAGLVREKNLGLVVGSENEEELASAIVRLAQNKELCRQIKHNIKTVKPGFFWKTATEPLVRYCQKFLSHKVPPKKIPSPKELIFITTSKKNSFLEESGNKLHFRLARKLPFRLVSKMKRLFKSPL